MSTSLALSTLLAAIILLAAMAVGHAEVGGLTTDLHVLDAAARVLAAASAVVLLDARCANPGTPSSAVPSGAPTSYACGAKMALSVLHSAMNIDKPSNRLYRATPLNPYRARGVKRKRSKG